MARRHCGSYTTTLRAEGESIAVEQGGASSQLIEPSWKRFVADSTGKVLNQVGGSSLEVAYTDLLVDFVCQGGIAIFCNSLVGGAAENMAALDCGRAFPTLCLEGGSGPRLEQTMHL